MSPNPIALYGSTGFTGVLTALELERLGLDYFLAGRNEEKLKAQSESLKSKPKYRVGRIDDPDSLKKALKGAGVVIACAGPFTRYGLPAVEASIAVGAHYLDSTGELPFMKMIYDRFNAEAKKKGLVLLSGSAYEYALSDLGLANTVEGFDSVESLEIGYFVRGFGASIGTNLSILEVVRSQHEDYEGGKWIPNGGRIFSHEFPLGNSGKRKTLHSFPGGEILLAPQHVPGLQRVRTYMSGLPGPAIVKIGKAAMKIPGVFGLVEAKIKRGPTGPTEEQRKSVDVTIVQEAKGVIGGQRVDRAFAINAKDGYGMTAFLLAEQARRLAAGEFKGSGVTAPSAVFDRKSFKTWLTGQGVTFEEIAQR